MKYIAAADPLALAMPYFFLSSSAAHRPLRRSILFALLAPALLAALTLPSLAAEPNAEGDLQRPAVPAETAVKGFKLPEGLEASLFVAEEDVAQPLSVSFDDRGRMWVVQYRQYPNPAGLKPVKVDQYLRTVYDKVPEPPPHGPRGQDRITIYEDTNGGRPARPYQGLLEQPESLFRRRGQPRRRLRDSSPLPALLSRSRSRRRPRR